MKTSAGASSDPADFTSDITGQVGSKMLDGRVREYWTGYSFQDSCGNPCYACLSISTTEATEAPTENTCTSPPSGSGIKFGSEVDVNGELFPYAGKCRYDGIEYHAYYGQAGYVGGPAQGDAPLMYPLLSMTESTEEKKKINEPEEGEEEEEAEEDEAAPDKKPVKKSALDIKGTQVPEAIRPGACEAHIGFKYDLPDDPAQWNLNNILQGGANSVYTFIDRVGAMQQSRVIYLHAFTSWEGSEEYNKMLANKRADAVMGIMNDYIASQPFSTDITVDVRKGTIKAKAEDFWKLSDAEKNKITQFSKTQPKSVRVAAYKSSQALSENRRAVLTLNENAYSIVLLGGGSVLLNEGCPPPGPDPVPPTPNETGTCGDGKIGTNESCDPKAKPSGCLKGLECQADCACKAAAGCFCLLGFLYSWMGMDVCDWNVVLRILACWWWLIFLIPFIFKIRRYTSEKRPVSGDESAIGNRSDICVFLEILKEKKNILIKDIQELEEGVKHLEPDAKKNFGKYLKNFRDPAYLRDITSQESRMLNLTVSEEIKPVFELYLKLVYNLLVLEDVEATFSLLLEKLKEGLNELTTKGTSPTLAAMGIKLVKDQPETVKLAKLIPLLEAEVKIIMQESDKIERTLEEHVKEIGFLFGGLLNLGFKGRWAKKFKKKHGQEALDELWWIKKNLGFNAPIYSRREFKLSQLTKDWKEELRTPERHSSIMGAGREHKKSWGKWDEDTLITTREDSPEEKRWREQAKNIWGKDILAVSVYIERFGKDIVLNMDKDGHVLGKLFNTHTPAGGTKTEGDVPHGGAIRRELDLLAELRKILCLKVRGPLTVEITNPQDMTRNTTELSELLAQKDAFKAEIKGGKPPYKYLWHWGPYVGDKNAELPAIVGDNMCLSGDNKLPVTVTVPKRAKVVPVEIKKGWRALGRKAAVWKKTPFHKDFSVDKESKRYLLHIAVEDSAGKKVVCQRTINVSRRIVIEGTVVEHDHPEKPVEKAEVWVTHSEFPDAKVIVKYTEDEKDVCVETDEKGRFRIEGAFKHHIVVHAAKGEGRGNHTRPPHGRPSGPIEIPEGKSVYKPVVVPLRFLKGVDIAPPPAIDQEIFNNIKKISDVNLRNQVLETLSSMKSKAGDISMQKRVFGPKDNAANPDIKRISRFVSDIYGENVAQVQTLLDIVKEKKAILGRYMSDLKAYEAKLTRMADEAMNKQDQELFNIYEKMITCFSNIRDYITQHELLHTLDFIELMLEESIDLEFGKSLVNMNDKNFVEVVNVNSEVDMSQVTKQTEYRAKAKADDVDRLVCELFRWKHGVSESNANWTKPGFLVEDFDKILNEILEQKETLRRELGRFYEVLEENYHHFAADLQEFHELQKSRDENETKALDRAA
ncbi:hypothetical protein ACFL3V_06475 [Nanoarchaeota archaeon]